MSDKSEPTEIRLKIYNAFREQVTHENTLYNNRITWLITLNSFLFAGISLLFRARMENLSDRVELVVLVFVLLICCVGFCVSAICSALLSQSRRVLNWVRDEWDGLSGRGFFGDQMSVVPLPHPSGGDGKKQARTLFRSGNLPTVMMVSWVLIFLGTLWLLVLHFKS